MSEVLRELIVSLSLDSDNFSRNLRTINAQIKEAESAFRLAGAGATNFERTLQGMDARVAMLTSKHQDQTRAVDQYSRALDHATQKMLASNQRQEKMTLSLAQARAEYTRLKGEVSAAGQQYNRLKASLGVADSATIAAKANLDAFKDETQQARDRVKLLEGQIKSNTKTLQNNADAVSKATTALNEAKAELRELTKELARQESAWTKAGTLMTAFAEKSQKVSDKMVSAGRGFTRALTTPIVAIGAASIKASVDFESAFTSVRKTVAATEEEFGVLSGSIKDMSTRVASAATDIAEVVAVAGQMGIANQHLMSFAKTMIDLGNSTDIDAANAAMTLSKFANIASMDQSKFQNLGSTLVDLGNNYAATESQILEMSMRLAGAGHQVGMSEAQILGFAAALSAVGIEAQMGGSAFSKALIKMEVASETGGQALKDFAGVAGLTTQEFKALWDSNPADAFQAFIGGLSKMDDEGASAIVTLQEIGISEVRLRDTLMRATNATKLFSDTQTTATKAWAENTALTVEAEKRYATTASRLTNLKNTAMLFAQKIGDDLNPAIKGLVDKANEMLAVFMGMDEAQRMSIIKFAGVAAAIGPALLILGKTIGLVSKTAGAFGSVATTLGKFSASISMAGGGLGGFVKVVASSPVAMAALGAAVIAGAALLYDYASGARKAREALEGMQQTAKDWKGSAADTFYGKGGLSLLGMTEADFTRDEANAREWMNGLLDVWAGSKYKKKAVVKEWTDSFKGLTEQTRSALKEKQEDAKGAGYTDLSTQMEADIKALDGMDKEISRLLSRRQNGKLSDKDKVKLQELVDAREAIEIRYKLTAADEDGFETIRQKIEAARARAQAQGKGDADVSVYEAATVAAAQGAAAMNQALDDEYNKEYALIQLMTDKEKKEAALNDLNTRYIQNRNAAAAEYARTLAGIIMPVWNQPDVQKAEADVDKLNELLMQYSVAAANNDTQGKATILDQMNKLTAGMNEAALAEYTGMLTQIQSLLDSGLTQEQVQALFPEIDFTAELDQLAALSQFVTDHKDTLTGLSEMLGVALPEEVLKIATDLDMTGAQSRWDTFAANPGAITTEAVVAGYSNAEGAMLQNPVVTAFINQYTEVPEGASTASLTPDGLVALVNTYAEAQGVSTSELTPDNITVLVAAYKEIDKGADMSTLTPADIVARIGKYLEAEGIDLTGLTPAGLTAFVNAYEEITTGAATSALTPSGLIAQVTAYAEAQGVSVDGLTPGNIVAMVTAYHEIATGPNKDNLTPDDIVAHIYKYLEASGVDTTGLAPGAITAFVSAYQEIARGASTALLTPMNLAATIASYAEAAGIDLSTLSVSQLNAIVAAYANALGVDPNLLLAAMTATIAEYKNAEGVTPPTRIQALVGVVGYDLTAYNAFVAANPVTVNGLIRLGQKFENPATVLEEPNAIFWENGKEIPVNLVPASKITADTLIAYEEDGTLHVLITPEYSGTPEAIEAAKDGLPEGGPFWEFLFTGKKMSDLMARVRSVGSYVDYYNKNKGGLFSPTQGHAEGEVVFNFNGEDVSALQTYVGEVVKAIQTGQAVSPEDIENLQSILDLIGALETAGVGENIVAGIGQAMAEAGWADNAETTAGNLEAAINLALGIESPSTRMIPVGHNAAAGIGKGVAEAGWSTDAETAAGNLKAALNGAFGAEANSTHKLYPVGLQAMAGLSAGIRAGQAGVVAAMVKAALAAIQAAKDAMGIESPSTVFRDEVGRMAIKGLSRGVILESREQAKVVANAARFLTDSAKTSAVAYNNSDNRRTYQQQSSVTLTGNTFQIRSEQDITALAREMASLLQRQHGGRGTRG